MSEETEEEERSPFNRLYDILQHMPGLADEANTSLGKAAELMIKLLLGTAGEKEVAEFIIYEELESVIPDLPVEMQKRMGLYDLNPDLGCTG